MSPELTLDRAIDVARYHELAQVQLKTISSSMSMYTQSSIMHQRAQFLSNEMPNTQRNIVTVCNLEMNLQCNLKDVAFVETNIMLVALFVLQEEKLTKYVSN